MLYVMPESGLTHLWIGHTSCYIMDDYCKTLINWLPVAYHLDYVSVWHYVWWWCRLSDGYLRSDDTCRPSHRLGREVWRSASRGFFPDELWTGHCRQTVTWLCSVAAVRRDGAVVWVTCLMSLFYKVIYWIKCILLKKWYTSVKVHVLFNRPHRHRQSVCCCRVVCWVLTRIAVIVIVELFLDECGHNLSTCLVWYISLFVSLFCNICSI